MLFFNRLNAQDTLTERFSSPQKCIFKDKGIVSNGYFLKGNDGMYNYSTIFKPLNLNSYKIAAKVRFEKGEVGSGFGLMFEASMLENANVFLISKSGYFLVGQFNNSKFDYFTDWQKSEYIFKDDTENFLEIFRDDNLTRFYINGNLVFSTSKVKNFGFWHGYLLKGAETEISSSFFSIISEKEKMVFNSSKKPLENINSSVPEIAPIESDDEKMLYFSRIDSKDNYGGYGDCDIFFSEKNGKTYSEAQHFPYKVNDKLVNVVIKTVDKNHTLYIEGTYDENGTQISSEGISVTKKISDLYWTTPKPIKINNFFNKNEHVSYAFSSDLKVLIIAAELEDCIGGLDLYVSFLEEDGSYSEPQNLGKNINTPLDEGTPSFSPDNKILFFSSYGHKGYGNSDIFFSRRLSGNFLQWTQPQNIGSMVNTKNWEAYFSVSNDFKTAYFVSNDNENFDENIYTIVLPKELGPSSEVFLTVSVVDKFYNRQIQNSAVSLKTSSGFKQELKETHGKYSAQVGGFSEFTIISEQPNYKTVSVFFEEGLSNDSSIVIEMLPQKLRLKSIEFEYQSHKLASENYPELNKLALFLKKNPEMKITLLGHTEIGSNQSSQILSENRAESVKKYLVGKGVNSKRIACKGFAGRQPLSLGTSPKDKAKNRRVEVVLSAD